MRVISLQATACAICGPGAASSELYPPNFDLEAFNFLPQDEAATAQDSVNRRFDAAIPIHFRRQKEWDSLSHNFAGSSHAEPRETR